MKQLQLYFEDKEFEKIKKAKGRKSWHDFILYLVDYNLKGGSDKKLK